MELYVLTGLLVTSALSGFVGAVSYEGSKTDQYCEVVFTVCYWGAIALGVISSLVKVFS
jgi:hypothetical protein